MTKFNHFLGECRFLAKSLSNFIYLPWKFDNPYCHSIHKPHTDSSDLFLVMKYYYEFMPNCPTQEGCSCRIPTIFNNDYKIVQDKKNYIVEVNCAGRGLKHFPLLPKWTKTLDLSDNNVSIARFISSQVTKNQMTTTDVYLMFCFI